LEGEEMPVVSGLLLCIEDGRDKRVATGGSSHSSARVAPPHTCRVSASVKGRGRLSHALLRYTVGILYFPACAVICIFHICTHDYAYIG